MYLAVPSFKYGWATVCTERAVHVGALRTTPAILTLLPWVARQLLAAVPAGSRPPGKLERRPGRETVYVGRRSRYSTH